MKWNKTATYFIILFILFQVGCAKDDGAQETTEHLAVRTTSGYEKTKRTSAESGKKTIQTGTDKTGSQSQASFKMPEEPSVPLKNIDLWQEKQGIEKKNVQDFYDKLSGQNLYYSYQIEDFTNHQKTQYTIAFLETGEQYSKIISAEQTWEYLVSADAEIYALERQNQTAVQISPEKNPQLLSYHDLLQQTLNDFKNIYFLGEGQAEFLGEIAEFEEYTSDNRTFIRYYFSDKDVLGYRIFDGRGSCRQEMTIITLSNDLTDYAEYFLLPPDYEVTTLKAVEAETTVSMEESTGIYE